MNGNADASPHGASEAGPPGGKAQAFAALMEVRQGAALADGEVTIAGEDPFFRTPFKVGETLAATQAAIGVAANDVWEARGGQRQAICVDVAVAAAASRTMDYTQIRDAAGTFQPAPPSAAFADMLSVTQPWPTRDGRFFLPHLNLPHLAQRVLDVLGCDNSIAGISSAVARWNATELEEAIAAARACGGMVRMRQEWLAHPQGRFLAERPPVEVEKIGDSAPENLPPGPRPLSSLRVLDLTRILAGPLAGRTLAEQGADVLMVTSRHLPQIAEHVRDTSHGKRSCFLDLRNAADRARMTELVRQADVFIDGYRPGTLDQYGFGLDELTRLRPGLVVVDVSCFGSGGPFAARAGWEQVAQTVTGLCEANGRLLGAGTPQLLPAPVCDYTTGYLAGFGALLALARRARQGGSYHVRASLCRSAMFLQSQGALTDISQAPERLSAAVFAARAVESDTCYGRLRTIGPVLRMSQTPPEWTRPTPRLGGDSPAWLPRFCQPSRLSGQL